MKELEAYRELVAKLTEENNQLRQISLLQHRKVHGAESTG
jgi:hypothetical protein